MRILVLGGLGLPILAVSGVVAYGAVHAISESFDPAPAVQVASVEAPVSQSAASFVAAGVADWTVAQQDSISVSGFEDNIVTQNVPSSFPQPRSSDKDLPVVVVATTVQPKPKPAVRSAVKAEAIKTQAPSESKPATKRAFKMPWQTGIFQ